MGWWLEDLIKAIKNLFSSNVPDMWWKKLTPKQKLDFYLNNRGKK